MMFSELGAAELQGNESDSDGSVLMVLAATPESDRRAVIADHVRGIVATVFDCGVDDFGADDMLDDIGLDSMMAMEFRVRINGVFGIDLPVLEILRGVSVDTLAARVLADLELPRADEPADGGGIDALLEQLSDDELRALLGELEDP